MTICHTMARALAVSLLASALGLLGCDDPAQKTSSATQTSSPAEKEGATAAQDAAVACEEGRVDVDGHCCYPGQTWSAEEDACDGVPDQCPPGLIANGATDTCDTCGGAPMCENALEDCGEDGTSCLDVGVEFASNAQGLREDLVRATALFEGACTAGSLRGCNNLAVHVERGLGARKDLDRAADLYAKACEADITEACINRASIFEARGNLQGAKAMYERVCDEGPQVGCYNLAVFLERHPQDQRSLARAIELYEQGCDEDHALSCNNLATLIQRTASQKEGDTAALKRSRALYGKACQMEYPAACRNVGVMREKGRGGSTDKAAARAAYDVGCRGGDMNSCARFALFDARGIAGDPNTERASKLSMLACTNHQILGCTTLGVLVSRGAPEAVAGMKASKRVLGDKCGADDGAACATLASIRMRGLGGERDIGEAKSLYRKACDLKYAPACARLERMPGGDALP